MTSFRQLEANRRNALKSTGPRTEDGKQHSRRNAVRHGLTAETIIDVIEDLEDYKAFEATIIADYDAQTAVERELVLRLASLLWRSRRAIAIETGLFRIQAEILNDRRLAREAAPLERTPENGPGRALNRAVSFGLHRRYGNDLDDRDPNNTTDNQYEQRDPLVEKPTSTSRTFAHCFLRLANLDSHAFDRLNRYEVALWRQTVQTLIALQVTRRRR